MENIVIQRKCDSYEYGKIYSHISYILDQLKFSELYELKGKSILIKPNLVAPMEPEKAVTTHPNIVRAVVEYLVQHGAEQIGIGDSGLQTDDKIYETTGMNQIANEFGCQICKFDKYEVVTCNNAENKVLKFVPLSKYVVDADIVIDIPKLKIHHAYIYTGAVKNIFGTVPGGNKLKIHAAAGKNSKFEETLVDIYKTVKPTICILDGIIGLEGNGPCNGTPVQSNLLLGSYNGLALDIVACSVIGVDYTEVGYLKKFVEREKGNIVQDIVVYGDDVEVTKYNRPNLIYKKMPILFEIFVPPLYRLIKPVPKFDTDICIKCGICVRTCPVKALTLDNYPVVNKKKCISCFCCQEACRSNAINRSDAKKGKSK